EIADHGITHVNAESREKRFEALSFELRAELFPCGFCRECRSTCALDMVGLRIWCVPEHHDRITNELVDGPAFCEERLRQHREIARSLVHQNVGIGCLGNCRKIPHVGEENSNLLPGTAELS